MICSFAFAAEPAAGLKIAEFTGNAKVVLGVDLGTGSIAFTNAGEADIKLDLLSAGDKSTTGDNIWGELKIKADGDPIGLKVQQDKNQAGFDSKKISDFSIFDTNYFYPYGFKIFIDVAKLHIGSMAYIGIKKDGTSIDYVQLPDTGAAVYYVDPAMYYGQVASGYALHPDGAKAAGATVLVDGAGTGLGPDAPWGIVAGVSLPNLVNVDVDFRSINQWSDNPTYDGITPTTNQLQINSDDMNRFAIRAKVDVTAVPNLTAQAGIGTGFGGVDWFYDIAFGGKVAYKLMLDDKMFVMPKVAANAVYDVAAGTMGAENTTKEIGVIAQAGVLLGWGDKSKLNFLFSPDKDTDWGYYPGIEAGVQVANKNITGLSKDFSIGLNVSAFTGTLIENLSANAALEINNLMADKTAGEYMDMGAMANVKYDVKMDAVTITPKFGLYFLSITAPDAAPITDEQKTDVYIKAGVDITKIFANTTISIDYMSNDFVGGVGNVAAADQNMMNKPLGAITTTLKISF